MKRPIATLSALVSLFLLAGCASTPSPDTSQTIRNVDHAYVNAVDRQASRTGVRVFWVNPPRRNDGGDSGTQP